MVFRFGALHHRSRRVLLSGGAGIAQRFLQLGASLIILPLALHTLGVNGFGVWGAATSLAWAAGMLDLGLGGALVTLLPSVRQQGTVARDYVSACLFSGAAFGLALLAGGGLCLLLWPNLTPASSFLIAGACLVLNIPLGLSGALWFGLQKGHAAGLWAMAQTGLMLLFVIAAAWAHTGPAAMTLAVFGAGLLANAGSMAHALFTQPAIRPRLRPNFSVLRQALRHGGVLALIAIAEASAFVFDNVLTLHWLGPVAAAQMAVALRICITASGMLQVSIQAIWPEFVAAVAQNDHGWVRRTLLRGTLTVLVLGVGGTALIVLGGNRLLTFWLHENLHIPPALFLAVAGWVVALNLPRVAGMLLNALRAYRGQLLAQASAAAAALAAKPALAAAFGVAGILASTPLATLLILCPAFGWLAWRQLAAPSFRKPAA